MTHDHVANIFIIMPRPQSFSNQIRKLIDNSNETRYRLAIETGIDQAVLSRFMAGKSGLSMTSLDALAEFLGWEIKVRPKKISRK